MEKTLLLRMMTFVALVVSMCSITLAQSAASSGVFVDGKVLERKVEYISTTSVSFGDANVPRVAVEYSPLADEWSAKTDRDLFHPAMVKVLFGNVNTSVSDLCVREIESQADGNLHFRGLRSGEKVTVYTTGGRRCLTTTATADGAVVGMKRLPRGVYVIQAGSAAFKYINR